MTWVYTPSSSSAAFSLSAFAVILTVAPEFGTLLTWPLHQPRAQLLIGPADLSVLNFETDVQTDSREKRTSD